jgi:peptidoglycan hydrolase-like protein with peptidoglycan-binding domain
MSRQTFAAIIGVMLALGAFSSVSGAGFPGATQTSSSAAKKKKAAAKSKKKPKVKGQTAPTPDRIKEIQAALQKDGLYQGEPTGKWDEATTEAMRKYQDKIGVSPTGKIDAISLKKLGLGSETAGKGAPVPSSSSPASHPSVATTDPQAK